MDKLKVLSLFSGIGAFEKALTNTGVNYNLVGFSEIDKWAIKSYCAIHDVDESLNLGDIARIKEDDTPCADLITYGFPCQDISIAGDEKGINKKTRSGLLYEAERIIRNTKPKYAIAENVRNLVGRKFIGDFNKLLKRLESYGYINYWTILNSNDYNIPQSRERVFIVSIRKDIDDGSFEFPQGVEGEAQLQDFILDSAEGKYLMSKERTASFVENLDNKESILLDISQFGREGKPREYSEYAPTLAARDYKDPRLVNKYVKGKGHELRRLTPLEYWRLMGFEDKDYWVARKRLEKEIYNGRDMSNSQMYKQAGNSIVVNVLEEIFKNLLL